MLPGNVGHPSFYLEKFGHENIDTSRHMYISGNGGKDRAVLYRSNGQILAQTSQALRGRASPSE